LNSGHKSQSATGKALLKELWVQAARGASVAEERLLVRLRERFTVIARLALGREDAEDVVQEACLAVIRDYRSVGNPFEYSAWAVRILKNKIASQQRKRSVEKRVFSGGEFREWTHAHTDGVPDHELILTLKRCLEKMRRKFPRYVDVLRRVQEGHSTAEICAQLDISRDNLYVLLYRARACLRDCVFAGETES